MCDSKQSKQYDNNQNRSKCARVTEMTKYKNLNTKQIECKGE